MRAGRALRVMALCVGFGVLAAGARAQVAAPAPEFSGGERYEIEARRASAAPAIDGVLDEAAWQAAMVIDSFIQQEPSEGSAATERTEVRELRGKDVRARLEDRGARDIKLTAPTASFRVSFLGGSALAASCSPPTAANPGVRRVGRCDVRLLIERGRYAPRGKCTPFPPT